MATWRRSLLCRQKFNALLAVWLVNLAATALMSPLGLLGQLRIVTDWRAVVSLALLHAAVIGYWGVVLAGLGMSLYLDRRPVIAAREGS